MFMHGLLFIQPPPATIQSTLSTGSCSTTPPRATVHPALHRLLFNQPSTSYCSTFPPRGHVHPSLHRLLFNQPSIGYCSTFPQCGPIHPALHGVLFIHAQLARSIVVLFIQWQHYRVLFIQPPTGNRSSNPPTTLTVHQVAAGLIGFSYQQ